MSTTPQYRIEQYLAAINAAYLGDSPLPEYPSEPVWRIEVFLAAILSAVKGDSPVMACPDPVWHIEEFARAIYDALVGASPAWPCPTATNNIEAILHAIYKVVADGTETDGIATSWDIERWLLDSYDAAKQGGGGTKTTLSGNLPLTLANALSHAIVSLTRYGLCTQDGTPTPSAPVDIMCNNGTIRMVDDELPSGYSRLTYIESDGTSGDSGSNGYVDTGIIINSIDTDVEIDFQLTDTYAPSPRMAWGYMGAPSSLPRWGFGAYSSKWLGSPNGTASTGEVDTDRHVAVMRVYNDGSNSAFYNGTLDGETLYNTASLGNVSLFEGNDRWSVYLFARNNNNTAANFVPCKIFRFKVYKTGALANDLVPCKDSNGALGFYDLVTATFSVASGTLIAGAVDYSHAHIGADGTPEVLTVSENLYNADERVDNYYLESGGKPHVTTGSSYSGPIPVEVGKSYTFKGISGKDGSNNKRIVAYSTNTAPSSGTKVGASITVPVDGIGVPYSVTIDLSDAQYANARYIRFSFNTDDTNVACFEEGSGQTASVPMLLSVNDYKDEAEIISGLLTHKVGVKVLDGTEAWTLNGTMRYVLTISDMATLPGRMEGLCTHFGYAGSGANEGTYFLTSSRRLFFHTKFETVDDLKAFLAAQYAAGTPVIVVYPLAEETTEHITAQNLVTNEGTNTVDSVANVGPVTAEVTYKANT